MSESAYFPESWPLIFDFFTFLLRFMLDPDSNPVPEPDKKKFRFLRFRYRLRLHNTAYCSWN